MTQDLMNQLLRNRGFSEDRIMNNRGLIGAVMEEMGHVFPDPYGVRERMLNYKK